MSDLIEAEADALLSVCEHAIAALESIGVEDLSVGGRTALQELQACLEPVEGE